MTFRVALIIACTATLGLAAPASVRQSPAGHDLPKIERAKLVHVAAAKPKYMRGGVSSSSGDIDGDGTSDVVVTSPPKPKHKPVRKVRKHK